MKSVQVVSLKMVREGSIPWEGNTISTPDLAYRFLRDVLADEDREHFVVVAMNRKNRPVGFHTVAIGALDHSTIVGREVYKAVLLMNAACVVFAHNHPSGDTTPSPEDVALTKALKDMGQLLGVDVMDHLVIGEHGYASLRERGLM